MSRYKLPSQWHVRSAPKGPGRPTDIPYGATGTPADDHPRRAVWCRSASPAAAGRQAHESQLHVPDRLPGAVRPVLEGPEHRHGSGPSPWRLSRAAARGRREPDAQGDNGVRGGHYLEAYVVKNGVVVVATDHHDVDIDQSVSSRVVAPSRSAPRARRPLRGALPPTFVPVRRCPLGRVGSRWRDAEALSLAQTVTGRAAPSPVPVPVPVTTTPATPDLPVGSAASSTFTF